MGTGTTFWATEDEIGATDWSSLEPLSLSARVSCRTPGSEGSEEKDKVEGTGCVSAAPGIGRREAEREGREGREGRTGTGAVWLFI